MFWNQNKPIPNTDPPWNGPLLLEFPSMVWCFQFQGKAIFIFQRALPFGKILKSRGNLWRGVKAKSRSTEGMALCDLCVTQGMKFFKLFRRCYQCQTVQMNKREVCVAFTLKRSKFRGRWPELLWGTTKFINK